VAAGCDGEVSGAAVAVGTSSPPEGAAAGCCVGAVGVEVSGVAGLTAATLGTSSPPMKSAGRALVAPLLFLIEAGLGTSSPSVAESAAATVCESAKRVSPRAGTASGVAMRLSTARVSIFGVCGAGPAFEAEFAQADAPPRPERTTATKITSRSTRTPDIAGCPPKLADNDRNQILTSGPTSRKGNVA